MLRLTISVHPPLQSAFCENICGCFFILYYDSICSEMDFTLCHKTAREALKMHFETPHNEIKCVLSIIVSYSIEKKRVKIFTFADCQGRGG